MFQLTYKLKFLNLAISLEPYGVNYRLLDLTEFIVGNMIVCVKTHFLSWNIYFATLKTKIIKNYFSDGLKDFLYSLITRFSEDVNQLFLEREQRRLELRRTGTLPDFSSSSIAEDKTWRISPLPERLLCRNIDLGKIWLRFPTQVDFTCAQLWAL